jgi:hypothetical protein
MGQIGRLCNAADPRNGWCIILVSAPRNSTIGLVLETLGVWGSLGGSAHAPIRPSFFPPNRSSSAAYTNGPGV